MTRASATAANARGGGSTLSASTSSSVAAANLKVVSAPSHSDGKLSVKDLSASEHARGLYLEQLSWRPVSYIMHNILTPEECGHIKRVAEPKMEKSMVIDSTTGKTADDPIRTSWQTFLSPSDDKLVRPI